MRWTRLNESGSLSPLRGLGILFMSYQGLALRAAPLATMVRPSGAKITSLARRAAMYPRLRVGLVYIGGAWGFNTSLRMMGDPWGGWGLGGGRSRGGSR